MPKNVLFFVVSIGLFFLASYVGGMLTGRDVVNFLWPIRTVNQYGPLKIGGTFGPHTYFPGPRDYPIEMADEANFFVHVVQKDLDMCMFESCGMTGVLVECMHGWLSGNSRYEISDQTGLEEKWDDVLAGKASMIVVSDKSSKIVGIYPNATMHDLPRILKKHPDITMYANECELRNF